MSTSPFAEIKSQIADFRTKAEEIGASLKTLEALVDRLENAVGPLLKLFPQAMEGNARATDHAPILPMPTTLKDRVLLILKESREPIKPRPIVTNYLGRGWPVVDEKQLYSSVRATLAFLKKDGHVNHNEETGYSYKER